MAKKQRRPVGKIAGIAAGLSLLVGLFYFVGRNFNVLSFAVRHPDVVRETERVYSQVHQEADKVMVDRLNGNVESETVQVVLPKE